MINWKGLEKSGSVVIEIMVRHLHHKDTEEEQRTPQSSHSVTWPEFELGTYRTRSVVLLTEASCSVFGTTKQGILPRKNFSQCAMT